MVFIGKSVDSPILSESSPFQHEGNVRDIELICELLYLAMTIRL